MQSWTPLPFLVGDVMWYASPDIPYPKISAWISAPLCFAWFSSSKTTMPAPSLRTKPSRLASNGLEALSGSSLKLVDRARMLVIPANTRGFTQASVPPATMTSAAPCVIIKNASPMEWAPVAHAVNAEWFGPWRPNRMLTCPAGRFVRVWGTK